MSKFSQVTLPVERILRITKDEFTSRRYARAVAQSNRYRDRRQGVRVGIIIDPHIYPFCEIVNSGAANVLRPEMGHVDCAVGQGASDYVGGAQPRKVGIMCCDGKQPTN